MHVGIDNVECNIISLWAFSNTNDHNYRFPHLLITHTHTWTLCDWRPSGWTCFWLTPKGQQKVYQGVGRAGEVMICVWQRLFSIYLRNVKSWPFTTQTKTTRRPIVPDFTVIDHILEALDPENWRYFPSSNTRDLADMTGRTDYQKKCLRVHDRACEGHQDRRAPRQDVYHSLSSVLFTIQKSGQFIPRGWKSQRIVKLSRVRFFWDHDDPSNSIYFTSQGCAPTLTLRCHTAIQKSNFILSETQAMDGEAHRKFFPQLPFVHRFSMWCNSDEPRTDPISSF